jgi:uncharacterized protein YggE
MIVALLLPFAAQAGDEEPRRISVSGQGSVDLAPDMAVIDLGVTHRDMQAAAALRKTSRAAAAMLERLSGLGVEARDVQTSSLSLRAVWEKPRDDARRVHAGFEASNMITVRLRDLDIVGEALDLLVADGANQLNNIRFALEDPQDAMDEARRRAVADAVRRAEIQARAAGVSVGDVLSIDESGAQVPQFRDTRMEMAQAAPVPVAGGEVGVSASVSMVFELVEAE